MAIDDSQREELLAQLLVEYDEALARDTPITSLDASAIAADAELAAKWDKVRPFLELLDRVRRQWTPEEAAVETPAWQRDALSTPPESPPATLGRFRILGELGRGGLGVVYLAYDPKLRRQVALKVPRPESLTSHDLRRRFVREAEAAARLNHPNLVAVYDAGEEGPLCYIAAEFCPGPTLAAWLKKRQEPVPIELASRMTMQLARAVQHAHGRGVLHRDIKPSNVLLASADAQRESNVAQADRLNLIAPDSRFATPDSPAPAPSPPAPLPRGERGESCAPDSLLPTPDSRAAAASPSGHRGAAAPSPSAPLPRGERGERRAPDSRSPTPDSLFPKLTDFGMAKLLERGGDETRSGALIGTPAYMAPEQAEGRVQDLDARTDVYALGAVLYELLTGRRPHQGQSDVEVLRHVLFDEPIAPRRLRREIPRDLEAICQKCLAKRSEARYATAQELADDLERFLEHRPTEARPPNTPERLGKWARRRPALAALAGVVVASLVALFATIVAYNARLQAEIARAEEEATTSRRLLYSADVRLAHEAFERNNVVQTLKLLDRHIPKHGEEDLREFAWHYLRGQCHAELVTLRGHEETVFSVAYSPDGRLLATASEDGTARLWNVSRSGIADDKESRILRGHTTEVTCVAFAPDGQLLATGSEDHTIRLWCPETGQPRGVLKGHTHHVLAIAFSPDGKWLVSGGRAMGVRVWDVAAGRPITTLAGEMEIIRGVAFSPQGDLLFAVDEEGRAHVWRTSDWEPLNGVSRSHEQFLGLAVSPDGERVAGAGRLESITLWQPTSAGLAPVSELVGGHSDRIQSLAFSPVGSRLASGGKDGVIHIWQPDEQSVDCTFLGHTDRVWCVAWSPDGRHLASSSGDNTVKIWDAERMANPRHWTFASRVSDGVYLADGTTLLLARFDGTVQVWDTTTERPLATYATPDMITRLRISSDDALVATRDRTTKVTKVWTRETGEVILSVPDHGSTYSALAWHPQEHRLATTIDGTTVAIVDVNTGRIERRFEHRTPVRYMAFLPDGRHLVTTSHSVEIWDTETGQLSAALDQSHYDVVVSPDGRFIAAENRSKVLLIDGTSCREIASLVPSATRTSHLAISPDGRTLAVALRDPITAAPSDQQYLDKAAKPAELPDWWQSGGVTVVSLWDTRTHQELFTLACDAADIDSLNFTPRGDGLVATGYDAAGRGFVCQWRLPDSP